MQTEQEHEDSANGAVAGVQLRLFPPPKPLLERFGQAFFQRVPPRPGVYLMGGQPDRLLYVGQSRNLRSRLNRYKNLDPERAPRKLVRLIHQITSITWEVCGSPKLAQLRENELLRLHKPKFNVTNTRPEHYGFLGLQTQGQGLVLRLANSPEAEPMETLWGAFKGSVRVAYTALSRLLWTIASQSTSPYDILSVLVDGRLPERFVVELSPATLEPVCNALASFLSGESDGFLDLVSANLPGRQGVCPFLIRLWEHDTECLREFYQLGPQRNRELRWRFDLAKGVIEQAELDDLLVISRQEACVEVS